MIKASDISPFFPALLYLPIPILNLHLSPTLHPFLLVFLGLLTFSIAIAIPQKLLGISALLTYGGVSLVVAGAVISAQPLFIFITIVMVILYWAIQFAMTHRLSFPTPE